MKQVCLLVTTSDDPMSLFTHSTPFLNMCPKFYFKVNMLPKVVNFGEKPINNTGTKTSVLTK